MAETPVPENEEERLEALSDYEILGTSPETEFDDLAKIAAEVCKTPIAFISFIDAKRQWFKAAYGLKSKDIPRNKTLCASTILHPHEVITVRELSKEQLSPYKLKKENIDFYAGTAIVNQEKHAIGTIAVMGKFTEELSDGQKEALHALARQVTTLLELKKRNRQFSILKNTIINLNERIDAYSYVDELTQLPNLNSLEEHLSREWKKAFRELSSISLIIADIDAFDDYNNTHGYYDGDLCLRKVAGLIAEVVKRPADPVARYLDDEFAILLPNTDKEGALNVAQKVQERIEAEKIKHGDTVITVSMGIASMFPVERDNYGELINAADDILAKARNSGRNQIKQFE